MSARKMPDGGEVVIFGDIDDDTLKAAVTVMRNEYRRRGLHERKPKSGTCCRCGESHVLASRCPVSFDNKHCQHWYDGDFTDEATHAK